MWSSCRCRWRLKKHLTRLLMSRFPDSLFHLALRARLAAGDLAGAIFSGSHPRERLGVAPSPATREPPTNYSVRSTKYLTYLTYE